MPVDKNVATVIEGDTITFSVTALIKSIRPSVLGDGTHEYLLEIGPHAASQATHQATVGVASGRRAGVTMSLNTSQITFSAH